MRGGIRAKARVRYSRAFLQSTAIYTGPIPFMKGTVRSVESLSADCRLALIDWDGGGLGTVNVCNLSIIGKPEKE